MTPIRRHDDESASDEQAERELLTRINAGDDTAFEVLFRSHYEGMCALAYMLIRSRDAAEDIAANVFRNLWRRRFDWTPTGPMRTYLLTATRNEAMNLLHQLRRQHGLEERLAGGDVMTVVSTPGAAPDEAAAAREIVEAVDSAVAELTPQCRTVFLFRWRDGLKHREIAERMDLSIKTVEMHMTRALRVVREHLRHHR